MRLSDAVSKALPDPAAPAAVLALTYAAAIDEASHLPLGLAAALDTLAAAARAADEANETDDAGRAHRKVATALATVTVIEHLGPKLLAALDALVLTPKANATIRGELGAAAAPTSQLDEFRDRHDSRHLRAAN